MQCPERAQPVSVNLLWGEAALSEARLEFGVLQEGVAVLSSWASCGHVWEVSSP